ncbi:hypothetical protein AVEN_184313-1 [Araneus ventricosus]|uniref:Uncharacterized protein n=1 Tax=Araneus ventricosus TaxID=182803 RepID=A0A4Y2K4M9_ARAVE|nr:hypothetical protein AVEN_184313-1 [Araneus ventricosus]
MGWHPLSRGHLATTYDLTCNSLHTRRIFSGSGTFEPGTSGLEARPQKGSGSESRRSVVCGRLTSRAKPPLAGVEVICKGDADSDVVFVIWLRFKLTKSKPK